MLFFRGFRYILFYLRRRNNALNPQRRDTPRLTPRIRQMDSNARVAQILQRGRLQKKNLSMCTLFEYALPRVCCAEKISLKRIDIPRQRYT